MDDRAEAIDILTRMSTNHFYGHREQEAFKLGAEALSEERLGIWTTRRTMEHDGETYCDQCGWTWEDMTHGKINVTRTPFCPNCGARMRMTRE